MLYLLSVSWEWLVAALALGLVVGWLTTAPGKEGSFSGHGTVVAAAFLLACGFLLANLQTVHGRVGLALEITLLFVSAYALGLPVGGGARLLTAPAAPAAPSSRNRRKTPPPVVVRGEAPRKEEPASEAAAPVATPVETVTPAPSPTPAPVVAAASPSKPAPTPAEPEKKLPGERPAGMSEPRGGRPDDLTRIKGVGPKSVEKLNALGVYHFDQIAAWTPENVKWISASLAAPGRPERGRWVTQAKELASVASSAGEAASS